MSWLLSALRLLPALFDAIGKLAAAWRDRQLLDAGRAEGAAAAEAEGLNLVQDQIKKTTEAGRRVRGLNPDARDDLLRPPDRRTRRPGAGGPPD